jgi:hypothetical protein
MAAASILLMAESVSLSYLDRGLLAANRTPA